MSATSLMFLRLGLALSAAVFLRQGSELVGASMAWLFVMTFVFEGALSEDEDGGDDGNSEE